MVRREIVSYTLNCDVGGEEIARDEADDASRTISWQGRQYLLDLCAAHQAQLTAALDGLKMFIDAARPASTGRRPVPAVSAKSRRPKKGGAGTAGRVAGAGRPTAVAAIRAWALENGHQIGDRGRIPAPVVTAYNQAQLSAAAPEAPTAPVDAPTAPQGAPERRTRKKSPAAPAVASNDQAELSVTPEGPADPPEATRRRSSKKRVRSSAS